jgi:hypothetical protein
MHTGVNLRAELSDSAKRSKDLVAAFVLELTFSTEHNLSNSASKGAKLIGSF